jgi:hypothetical protein
MHIIVWARERKRKKVSFQLRVILNALLPLPSSREAADFVNRNKRRNCNWEDEKSSSFLSPLSDREKRRRNRKIRFNSRDENGKFRRENFIMSWIHFCVFKVHEIFDKIKNIDYFFLLRDFPFIELEIRHWASNHHQSQSHPFAFEIFEMKICFYISSCENFLLADDEAYKRN